MDLNTLFTISNRTISPTLLFKKFLPNVVPVVINLASYKGLNRIDNATGDGLADVLSDTNRYVISYPVFFTAQGAYLQSDYLDVLSKHFESGTLHRTKPLCV